MTMWKRLARQLGKQLCQHVGRRAVRFHFPATAVNFKKGRRVWPFKTVIVGCGRISNGDGAVLKSRTRRRKFNAAVTFRATNAEGAGRHFRFVNLQSGRAFLANDNHKGESVYLSFNSKL